jgi:hypothetical protein
MEINNRDQLKVAIAQLEQRAIIQKQSLTVQFHTTYENLQPINIIKNQLSKLTDTSGIQNDPISAVMGLSAGLLSKKLYERGSGNIFKQIIGSAVEFGVARIVANNSEKIKEIAASFLDKLFKPKAQSGSKD